MMKVILTKEQAEAIEKHKAKHNETNEQLIEFHYWMKSDANKRDEQYQDEVLNAISPFLLAQALLVGYEIEQPKFEVGDWAIRIKGLGIGEGFQWQPCYIFKVLSINGAYVRDGKGNEHFFGSIRRATKEEAFWAELGREVGEFRKGDVIAYPSGNTFEVFVTDSVKDIYLDGKLKGFYPAESFKPFPTGNK